MDDKEKLDLLIAHVARIRAGYGNPYPAEKVRAIALEILHRDSHNAREIFAVEGFFRDTFCDDCIFEMMSDAACDHLFEQPQQEAEKTEAQKLDDYFQSPEFLALDPRKRMAIHDSLTAEAANAKKEAHRKEVAAAVQRASDKIPEFNTWEPSRRSAFCDKIRADFEAKQAA